MHISLYETLYVCIYIHQKYTCPSNKYVGVCTIRVVLELRELPKQYLKRNILVFIEEHIQLTDTDPQVTISKLIRDIKAQCSKLSSLQCYSMKQ